MHITPQPNRRIRRAQARWLIARLSNPRASYPTNNYDRYHPGSYLCWLNDHQAARIARRCSLPSFRGMPPLPHHNHLTHYAEPNSIYAEMSPKTARDIIRRNLTASRTAYYWQFDPSPKGTP